VSLVLHNTLTNRAEVFKPADPGRVTMYVCGPTVYDLVHIGNARSAVVFDLLFRLLRATYGADAVQYVRNITDVDDKIIAAARERGEDPAVLARRYAAAFREDIAKLNVLRPTVEPLATEYVTQMVALAGDLVAKGHAYEAEGHVIFDVASHAEYGELSNRKSEDLIAGARVEVAPYKRNPGDFVLWKPSSADEPGWDSPWGRGRPGWHLECSAMASDRLGETIDIHGGGQDLIFPHHENEIAQSRCAHGTERFARYWVHNGFLTMSGSKMAKSVGNIVLLRKALEEFHGEAVRYALLSGHYRKPLDWSGKLLTNAKVALDRLYLTVSKAPAGETAPPPKEFTELLENDLNTPSAIAMLHDLGTRLNKETDAAERARLRARTVAAGNLLGLLEADPAEWFRFKAERHGDGLGEERIAELVAERDRAKAERNYGRADEIRDELKRAGVLLEDSKQGTTWRWE